MDVTPPDGMLRAMMKLTDAAIGEEPMTMERSPAAEKRRMARRRMMDILHDMTAMAMRVGAARALKERGFTTIEAPMKNPNHG